MLSFLKSKTTKPASSPTSFSKKGQGLIKHLIFVMEEFEMCLEREEYYFNHRPGFIARGLIAMKTRLAREYEAAVHVMGLHFDEERPPKDLLLFLKDRMQQFSQKLQKNHEEVRRNYDVLRMYDESVRRTTLKQQPKVFYGSKGHATPTTSIQDLKRI